ncbi:GrxB family glutaredoxin [Photobacterium lutimaris]|uniref:Glutaredoxin n=1 Tax=Photobacterium lutimaris TaxID=388278 RepID=A0A2T3J4P3_9GAMM|nr:GrxB family glutaredoxin [Photobacterium lutimaris]PSU36254.1 glutaredoxin [Photobacterium lutimaris]TDR74866.1 glutaredoxin 2 [Photobacterium lutimaris]
MKLYIYEHCPFSARVRFVAGMLNLAIDVVTIDYDDDKTTTDIIGNKQVPVFVKGDGEAIVESLDIINHFLNLADSVETNIPSQAVLDWQRSAFSPLQKVGYPRWSLMDLKEFSTDSSKKAWRSKKETEALNFDALLADTSVIAEEVEALIRKAGDVLHLGSDKRMKLVDEAIVFSILRGFFCAPEINWDLSVKEWMESVSKKTNVKLLK